MLGIFYELIDLGAWLPLLFLGAAVVLYLWVCSRLFLIDLRTHRLPNKYTALLAAGGVLLLGCTTFLAPSGGLADGRLLGVIGGALSYTLVMFALHVLTKGGLGMGDVKLAAGLGAYTGFVGWDLVVLAAMAAFMIGGAVSLFLVLTKKATKTTRVPFGPAMILGATLPLLVVW